MSKVATSWAFEQGLNPSSLQFTLVALCFRANHKTGKIMSSAADICALTGQNRKTVLANIAELERRGLIINTGRKTGRTGQIKIYTPAMDGHEGGNPNDTENGTLKESQKGDAIPKTAPFNGPVFTIKESRFRDTEPYIEPIDIEEGDRTGAKKVGKGDLAIKPDGVTDQTWTDFLTHRKAKKAPVTVSAFEAIQREAAKAGWNTEDALIETMSRGWQGFKAAWVEPKAAPAVNANSYAAGILARQTERTARRDAELPLQAINGGRV